MRRIKSFGAVLAAAAVVSASAAAQDIEGAEDHEAVGRFQGSTITKHERKDYDAQRMLTDAEAQTYESPEGEVTRILYDLPEAASMLQVRRSFEQALEEDGFEVLTSCADAECGGVAAIRSVVWGVMAGVDYQVVTARRAAPGEDAATYAQVAVGPSWVNVNVVETTEFESKVVDAEAVAGDLAESGSAVFYDINFDTGSAALRSGSGETLALIAEVLAADPGLDIVVVGHTDDQGGLEDNTELSRARAAAVVAALVSEHDVDAGRLDSAGIAYLAPVASNATEEGRAKNRRVTIVPR